MTTLSVQPDHLATAISAVLPHVIKDNTLPAMEHVQIEWDAFAQTLTFRATDRYTVGEDTVQVGIHRAGGAPEPRVEMPDRKWLVEVSELKKVLADVKASVKQKHLQNVSSPGYLVTWDEPVDGHQPGLRFGSYLAVPQAHVWVPDESGNYQFPKMNHLWPKDGEAELVAQFGINPDYWQRFATKNIARPDEKKNHALTLKFGPKGATGPIKVEFSDHFRALVMPMRVPS